MRLWIDDVRPAPSIEYYWVKSVNEAKNLIIDCENRMQAGLPAFFTNWGLYKLPITELNIDHDAGDYASDGGDYIKLLDWLEETGRNYPIHIHSMNPVGVANMRAIIERNGWEEVR